MGKPKKISAALIEGGGVGGGFDAVQAQAFLNANGGNVRIVRLNRLTFEYEIPSSASLVRHFMGHLNPGALLRREFGDFWDRTVAPPSFADETNKTGTSFTANWNEVEEAEGGGYKIYLFTTRNPETGVLSGQIGTAAVKTDAQFSHTFTGLTPLTNYYVAGTTVSPQGESDFSQSHLVQTTAENIKYFSDYLFSFNPKDAFLGQTAGTEAYNFGTRRNAQGERVHAVNHSTGITYNQASLVATESTLKTHIYDGVKTAAGGYSQLSIPAIESLPSAFAISIYFAGDIAVGEALYGIGNSTTTQPHLACKNDGGTPGRVKLERRAVVNGVMSNLDPIHQRFMANGLTPFDDTLHCITWRITPTGTGAGSRTQCIIDDTTVEDYTRTNGFGVLDWNRMVWGTNYVMGVQDANKSNFRFVAIAKFDTEIPTVDQLKEMHRRAKATVIT